jgi:hypothetical protein
MKRLPLLLAILFALALLPERAEAQFALGARAKMMFPTGSFDDEAKTGWGIAGTGDFTLIPLVKLRGEIGYNRFDGDTSGGVTSDDWNIWNFGVGARLQLPIIYVSLDGMYYTEIDDFSLLPGVGARFLFLDVGARYKWSGENWVEVFGGVAF